MRAVRSKKIKRVQVTFTEEQWLLIEKLRGVMGYEDAEIVRNITLAWLAEKSVISTMVKKGLNPAVDDDDKV